MAQDQDLSVAEEQAFALSQAAIRLDQSRQDQKALAESLEFNLETWLKIRTALVLGNSGLTEEARSNLRRLGDYVARVTLSQGVQIDMDKLDSLVAINLQISEGLLESALAGAAGEQ